MNQLSLTLAGALALTSGIAAGQEVVSNIGHVDAKNIRYAGVYNAVTQQLTPASASRGVGTDEVIYRNSAAPTTFYNLVGGGGSNLPGGVTIDEGRLPGPTSPGTVGTLNSYMLTNFQIAYVTNATDPSLGGNGIDLQLKIYENFAPCGLLETTDAPIATLDLLDLPASTSGGFAGLLVDVDLTGLDICLRADGDDDYSDGTGDLFGWSIEYIDNDDGTGGGPFLSGDPANSAFGDGTFFQNPTLDGTGLDTQDLWRELQPDGTVNCYFFGGYVPGTTPFSSFYAVISGDVVNECIGCGIGDDRFEANDAQIDAAPVDIDSYGALISNVDDDFYSVIVPAGEALNVDILFSNAISDLDLRILNAAGSTIDSSLSITDDESVMTVNCDEVNPQQYFIRVNNFDGVCNEYDMIVTAGAPPADDAFEENDTCLEAVPGPLGTTQDLVVRPFCNPDDPNDRDGDYYSYTLADGETMTVNLIFEDAITDIDGVIYDVSGGCPGTPVAFGFSTTDNENLSYTNSTGASLDVVLRVDLFSGDYQTYDMSVKIGPATIGELICLGDENSVGSGAEVCATGSTAVVDDDVNFDVSQLPMSSMGYFLVSQEVNLVANPGGSSGTLCIASFTFGRYASAVLDSGMTGTVSFGPGLSTIPSGTALIAAAPGDTFNWQYWYRDVDGMGMPTSNFSDAVSILFD